MKRQHRHLFPPALEVSALGGGGAISSSSRDANASMAAAIGKGRSWEEKAENDAGVDELLAVLGYKVRSSDMAEVAQQLKHLEELMGNPKVQDDVNGLASETVHYNPSDLSGWLENMLSGFGPPQHFNSSADPYFTPSAAAAANRHESSSDYDLRAIPGRAVLRNTRVVEDSSSSSSSSSRKRLKSQTSPPEPWEPTTTTTRPVVLLDSQENGIRLVHTLTACAEALQQGNRDLAEVLVKQIGFLAASQAGAMGKVATYFAEALAFRVYRLSSAYAPLHDPSLPDKFHMHFYVTSPYLKFAHFTANQAILQAFAGRNRVHVIDLAVGHGLQWPALMKDLSIRPGGPPAIRFTGIGPPSPDGADRLRDVGVKLALFAERINVRFEYKSFVARNLTDLDPAKMGLVPGEAVAVNSVFELHKALAVPGGIGRVLSAVRAMGPEIVTVVEQEASHNGPLFVDRFMEALRYYSTIFDSLEGAGAADGGEDRLMSEMYLGRQICNVVACEGADRVERHEPVAMWRSRFEAAGFAQSHMGSNAFKQASMLLGHFAGGDGFQVEENGGCLMLGWHTRALVTTSAWQICKRLMS